MLKLALLILVLLVTPAMSLPCIVAPANAVLDMVRDSGGEVPILRMKVQGLVSGDTQAFLVASPKGTFILFVLASDGRACILAIGNEMRAAHPNDRFSEEKMP